MSDSLFGFTSSFIVPTVVSIAIGSTPITSGAEGRILFQGAGNVVQESANITWDDTNKIFKVSTGTNGIVIEGDAGGYPTLKINTLRSGTTRRNWMIATEQLNAGDFVLYRSSTGGGVANTLVYSIFNDGNFGLNTSVNAGYTFDVNGTARVVNQLTASNFISTNQGTNNIEYFGSNNPNFIYKFSIRAVNNVFGIGSVQGMQGYAGGSTLGGYYFDDSGINYIASNKYTQIIGRGGNPNGINSGIYTFGKLNARNPGNLDTSGQCEINSILDNTTTTGVPLTFNSVLINPTLNTIATSSTFKIRGIYYNPTSVSIASFQHIAIETVTGDVLFGTTSGSLLVGTSSNSGFKADINGTMRVQNVLTVSSPGFEAFQTANTFGVETGSNNYRTANLLGWGGYNSGAGTNNTLDAFAVGGNSSSTANGNYFFRVNIAGGNSTGIYGATGTKVSLAQLNAPTSSKFYITAQGGGGLIEGSTSGFLISTISDGQSLNLRSEKGTGGSGGGINYLSSINGSVHSHRFFHNNTEQMRLWYTGNLVIQTGGTFVDAGYKLDVNGTMRVQSSVTLNLGLKLLTSAGSGHRFMRANDNGDIFPINAWNYGNSSGNTWVGGSEVASALFALNSTSTGFLPPRMTTAQKNAITSPALGLVVFDTTLNKLCVFTTVWETVTSI